MPSKKFTPRTCSTCKDTFFTSQWNINRGWGRFCSRQCARLGGPPPEARFWASVEKTDECWVWTGKLNSGGYGMMTVDGRKVRAHRFSWELHNGPVPDTLFVLHNCPGGDNRACVNPEHLWTGTHLDNITDCVKKGRNKYPRDTHGERNGHSKLTEREVCEIRRLYSEGVRQSDLARRFSVSQSTILDIRKRRIWRHIP